MSILDLFYEVCDSFCKSAESSLKPCFFLLLKIMVHQFLSCLQKVPFIYFTALIKQAINGSCMKHSFPFPILWYLKVCFPLLMHLLSPSLWLSVTVSGMKTTLKRPGRMSVFIRTSLWTRGRCQCRFPLRKTGRVLQRTRSSPWTSACPWTRPRCTCKCDTLSIDLTCSDRALADLTCPTAHLYAPNAVRSRNPNIPGLCFSSQIHMLWFY